MPEAASFVPDVKFIKACLKGYYSRLCRLYRFPRRLARVTSLYADRDGKFLRPQITVMILRAFGKDPERYRDVIGAMELMETTTISFDDMIDDSPSRRGGKSTHLVFGKRLSFLGFQTAYLASYRAFWELALPAWRKENILYSLTRDIFLYFFGQNSELYWSLKKLPPSGANYLSMSWDRIRFLSFNAPFSVGAHLAGVPREKLGYFRAAGSWLGMAYHLHGDELNIFPRSESWGKRTADDITSARYTYLLISALKGASGKDREFLLGKIGRKEMPKKDIIYLQDIIKRSGALRKNRKMAALFRSRYEYYLKKCFEEGRVRQDFLALGRYMCYEREK